MKTSTLEVNAVQAATQRTKIFNMIADGKKVGIAVALNADIALEYAISGLTRKTASKEDFPDYESIRVELFV